MFELTSYEPFVVTDVEGLFGACCITVVSKLLQDPILLVEDDLSYIISAVKNNFDFDNLLASWEVKAAVIILSACFASLPVTHSESERYKNTIRFPLSPGDSQASKLLHGHCSD